MPYDEDFLVTKFNMSQFFQKSYYPISFFYLGLLTRKDEFSLSIPNLNIRKIITEYLNELYHIDVSTRYEDAMRRFVQHPDLPRLFADYWQLYVSQLPEAIFTHIQENFYRTTFYELCSRYLSKWFTWNVERSYPGGRTDLEFVGKYNEKFAHLRILIEFKYISNTKFQSYHCPIENFPLKQKDTLQITGYARDLIREYPEVTLKKYVIYCIGNHGFRIYDLDST
ncbi:MAG: PD-(D/E)XK nuclease domain-containing protein [Methanospirillum sp.]